MGGEVQSGWLWLWYLIPPCLTLGNKRCASRVKWCNPGKGVAPSPTSWSCSYRKGSLLVALDYGRQLYFIYFSALLLVSYNPSSHFYPRPSMRAGRGYMYSIYFVIFFGWYFSNHIDSTPLRRWAVLQSAIIYISYRLAMTVVLLMCLCSISKILIHKIFRCREILKHWRLSVVQVQNVY